MGKKKNGGYKVPKTINEVLNMDIQTFNSLSASDLRKAVNKLASAGNKRLKTFAKNKSLSPAARHVRDSGGRFSTKGKNLNQLRSEFFRAKNFLEARTGTTAKWNKVKKDTIKELKKYKVNINVEQFDIFWEIYEKLKEISPEVAHRRYKYKTLGEISNVLKDDSAEPDEIVLELFSRLTEIYERYEGDEDEFTGVSEFFDF